jgi:thymidylate synthase (FAD)
MEESLMKVSLVSYSLPSQQMLDKGITDAQELVAYCARVSNPANQFNKETSEKLIKYLVKHKHWSPLEMASACLEIETTRDIAHQIVRHRSFAFQEFSQRYANPEEMGEMFEMREARLQDPVNRQNSREIDLEDDLHRQIAYGWENIQRDLIEKSKQAYEWAISKGIAKEQARVVLPEGLTKTRLYMNGSLRSWIHYIELRSGNGTQKEHMGIGKACGEVIATIFPIGKDFIQ